MPINEPTTAQGTPFQTSQPVVEWWDEAAVQWKTFPLGRMYVDRLNLRLFNQGLSEAVLRYECGEISFEGGQFVPIAPLSIDRTWVRITITTDDTTLVGGELQPDPKTIHWAGIIVRTEEDNRASTGGVRLITQRFTAFGMEWLMARRQIITSEVLPAGQIKHGLTFNSHSNEKIGRQTVKGNKHKDSNSVFADSDEDAEAWTGDAIVDYLELTAFPLGLWSWTTENLGLLVWLKPVVPCHGRSLMDILKSIASPRRGLDSYISYTPGANEFDFGLFTYRVESMFPSDTVLPSGVTVLANDNIVNIVASTHRDSFTKIHTNSSRRYDKVVALGARIGGIGSFSIADNSIDEGWSTDDQDGYKTGDPNVDPNDDLSRQRDEHDRFRRQKFPDVFTRFEVRLNWNGQVGDGEGGDSNSLFPNQSLHVYEMRFASYLPLKVGWDYQSIEPVPTLSAPSVDEFRKPVSIFKITGDRWEFGDQLGDVIDETEGINGYDFSCHTRPLDKRFGMLVRPTTVPHVLAALVSEPIAEDTSDHQPTLDFKKMIITAYTQSHDYVSAEFPDDPTELISVEHTHYLRLGDTAFLDFLPAGTVVDVLGGQLVRSQSDMYVRDDREYLADVARVAWQWYGFNRTASQLRYRQVTGNVLLGWMIGELDDVTANAIVTSILWDFQKQTTEIFTHFSEPDFAELAAR